MQLGISLLRQGKPDEAVEKFRDVLAINPKSAIAYNNIGVARAAQANQGNGGTDQAKLEQAIAEYQRAIELRPDWAMAHYNLGVAVEKLGDFSGAIAHFEKAIALRPDYAVARMARATGLIRLAGMMLPGNGWPVSGSRITVLRPEKSPLRHDAGATDAVSVPGALYRVP